MSNSSIFPGRSTWLHLRFGFSLYLLPVFLFALSQAPETNPVSALLVFFIWHFLVYPASNGYNSYFDKDTESIALLESPPEVDRSLYRLSLLLDTLALLFSLLLGWVMFAGVLLYGTFSKLYSHPLIRLKKYPLISFLVVFIFQGGFVYMVSLLTISDIQLQEIASTQHLLAAGFCSLLIGACYPLTQVYQHQSDTERGDRTLSILLGRRGSFFFAGILFGLALAVCAFYWFQLDKINNFLLFLGLFIPGAYYFLMWYRKVAISARAANFRNMSGMTILCGGLMLVYFGILCLV